MVFCIRQPKALRKEESYPPFLLTLSVTLLTRSLKRTGISTKSMDKLKDAIRVVTKRTQGVNLEAVIGNINPVIRGHVNYFRLGNVRTVYHSLDSWVRMRLRCFKFSRKWKTDNRRFPTHRFFKLGLLSFEREFLKKCART